MDTNIITLDFNVEKFDEHFAPTPKDVLVSFDISSLKKAIEVVKQKLENFEVRLERINRDNNLNIERIGELLIWDDEDL
ncbi:hypothetical protein [Sphingobacterium multivorum]|uniref:hypothetical protein n=1 Tax=Sphingobacterium multivorum TaxID=28454 RepID=UPI00301B0031